MYAASIHHITSVLLLQVDPFVEQQPTHIKNATWHAVRICGICIGNKAEWSYDPTILAALAFAGRFISYWEQKRELLVALQTLVKGSGWPVNSAIDKLVQQWRDDSGQPGQASKSSFSTAWSAVA